MIEFLFHDISQSSLLLNETNPTQEQLLVQEAFNNDGQDETMDVNANTKSQPTPFNATKVYNKFGNLNATSIKVIIHGFGASCPHVWVYGNY